MREGEAPAWVWKLEELSGRQFPCIMADPPWGYGNQATRSATGRHYPTMTLEALCALPVAQLAAPNAHLHLWTTSPLVESGFAVLRAWGFAYKSMFVWVKPEAGLGNYWRVSHEILLLGLRGRLMPLDKPVRSWMEHPRGEHSSKPDRIRELVEKFSPGPRLELFGRRKVPGWTVFGNEQSSML